MTIQVVRFHEVGNVSVLKIEDIPLQEPKEDEVRISVKAIALNRTEILFREGAYIEDPVFPARNMESNRHQGKIIIKV